MREIKTPKDYHSHIGFVVWSREGCASCPSVKAAVDKIATDRGLPAVEANAEEEGLQPIVQSLGLRSVPVTQAVIEGELVAQRVGRITPADMDQLVRELRKRLEAAQ